MKKTAVNELFRRLSEHNPAPKTELEHHNPYTLLVAVLLSAQATDVGVNRATPALFAAADTPHKMLALGEANIRSYIKSIGLFNTKAKNIMKLSRILVEQYEGQVPNRRDLLEQLPGIGRKSANVILNSVFGMPTIAVDTHVFRVSNRIGLARGGTPLAVERGLEKIVPAQWRQHAHHWLILHGRYTCTARKPNCPTCIVRDLCAYPSKTPITSAASQQDVQKGRPARPQRAKRRGVLIAVR